MSGSKIRLKAPFYVLFLLLPTAAFLWSVTRQGRRNSMSAIAPFAELRRRPAGESLRLQIEALSENIDEWIIGAGFVPVVLGLLLAAQPETDPIGIALFFLAAALLCGAAQRKLYPLLRKRSGYRLGYQ